jgi:glycosyltransferase involved in cell wall biosynthesis
VEFLPFVDHRELPRFFNEADAFVLPSFTEGHPKVLLEAMSCGVPCVAAARGGNLDIVVRSRHPGWRPGGRIRPETASGTHLGVMGTRIRNPVGEALLIGEGGCRERAEAQRRYDLARVSAGLSYLDGKTGQQVARTTELMGYVLQASQKR